MRFVATLTLLALPALTGPLYAQDEGLRYSGLTQGQWESQLADLNPEIRATALKALTHFPGGFKSIAACLDDDEDRIARGCAWLLITAGPYKAVPPVVAGFDSFAGRMIVSRYVVLDALLLSSETQASQYKAVDVLWEGSYASARLAPRILKDLGWANDEVHRSRLDSVKMLAGCPELTEQCPIVRGIREQQRGKMAVLPVEALRMMLGVSEKAP